MSRRFSRATQRMISAMRDRRIVLQNNLCWWCVCVMDPPGAGTPKAATADHVQARADGGRDVFGNIRAACDECNAKRGSFKSRDDRKGRGR